MNMIRMRVFLTLWLFICSNMFGATKVNSPKESKKVAERRNAALPPSHDEEVDKLMVNMMSDYRDSEDKAERKAYDALLFNVLREKSFSKTERKQLVKMGLVNKSDRQVSRHVARLIRTIPSLRE